MKGNKHTMTKEELTKKEAELTEKENGLVERENKLNERENGLNEREEKLNDKKADADEIVKSVKAEYEDKLLKQHDKYEERITERNKVIKQLLAGNGEANEPKGNPIVDKINARRTAQLKKW